MHFNDMKIDKDKAKTLWYALFGVCHSIENRNLQNEVNVLIDQTTKQGAYDFARQVLSESFIDLQENEE